MGLVDKNQPVKYIKPLKIKSLNENITFLTFFLKWITIKECRQLNDNSYFGNAQLYPSNTIKIKMLQNQNN
jgi:hypothetical protein